MMIKLALRLQAMQELQEWIPRWLVRLALSLNLMTSNPQVILRFPQWPLKRTMLEQFSKYLSHSFLDPTDIALQLVAKGHKLAAIQSSLHTISLSTQMILRLAKLCTCAQNTLQSNKAWLSLLSQNEQIPQLNPRVSIPLRSRWLSWTKARSIAFHRNDGEEKSGTLSSTMMMAFTFPSWWGGKGLVMMFRVAALSNCISLLFMRSWTRFLNWKHSSKVCPLAPKWCLHFLDGSNLGGRGPSLGL